MRFQLTWLVAVVIVVVAVVIGAVSAAALRDSRLRNLWALLVALVFVAAALTAVVMQYSWMFNDGARAMADAAVLAAAVVGLTYAIRAPG